jgi:hypothetical protein
MLRTCAIALLSVVAFGTAFAQQNVQKEVRNAKAGESCLVSYNDCGGWCEKNKAQIHEKNDCKQSCSSYHGTCVQTGVWSTPLGKVEIRGLPPK